MSVVPLASVRLTHRQLARLAAEEPGVRWPRALRALVTGLPDAPASQLDESVGILALDQVGDPGSVRLLRRGLRAFGRPWLRMRVLVRQGRLLTLTEIAVDAEGSSGSLSTLLLGADLERPPRQFRPAGRVELAATAASALPSFSLRHVPSAFASSPPPDDASPSRRPGSRPARTLVLRGWGRALPRPFVDVWAQDEHGWVRPAGGNATRGWSPVDAERFAAELTAVLPGSWPETPSQTDRRVLREARA